MRLTTFLVARAWRTNRLRTLLSILGIALGVAVVTAIQVMDHNTVRSRLKARDLGFGRADFELVAIERSADADTVAQRLLERDGVAAVGIVRAGLVGVSRPSGNMAPARLFGLWPVPDLGFGHYTVIEGRDLQASDGDFGVLIGAAWAREDGLRTGDELVLSGSSRARKARCLDGQLVAAASEEPAVRPETVVVRGLLAPRGLGSRDTGRVLVGSHALAARLLPRELAVHQVRRAPGSDVDALRQSLAVDFVVREEAAALLGESSDERAFRNGVKLLGGLALMLGMFVVFQTLSQSLVERLRQIGLLRALGASGASVSSVFLVDGALLALAGTGIGLVLGVGLAWLLQRMQISTLGMFKTWELEELPMRPLAAIAALGFLFTLAGAAFPLWRARGLATVRILNARGLDGQSDVLRGVNGFLFVLLVVLLPLGYLATTTLLSESERETQAVLLQLGALLLVFGGLLLIAPRVVRALGSLWLVPLRRFLPLETHLVVSSLRGQTGRFAASICGLAIVLLAGIALESLTGALHGDVRAFGRRAMPHSLFVRGDGTTPARARELESVEGVVRVEALIGAVAAPFAVSGLEPGALSVLPGPFAEHPEAAQRFGETRSLVISTRLARLSAVAAGGALTLITDAGPVPYLVLAVTDAAGFFPDDPVWALTHPRWMKQDFCVPDDGVERVVLRLAPDADPNRVLHAARKLRPDLAFSKSSDWLKGYLLGDVTRDFRLFQILLALILLLAIVGVVNATTIAALGRVREIGVLRSLGTSRAQLRRTFMLEGFVVGASASVVALLLGIPLGRIVVDGMNRVTGLAAPYAIPWHAVLAAPLIGVAAGLLAALLPSARAVRLEPADAVRFE